MYVWEQIQNEYIKAFGISEEYQAHLQQQRKAALLACRYIIEGKRHFLTHARALRNSGNFKAASATVNIHKNMAMLTKAYGVILKADKVTVREYYNYINALNHGK